MDQAYQKYHSNVFLRHIKPRHIISDVSNNADDNYIHVVTRISFVGLAGTEFLHKRQYIQNNKSRKQIYSPLQATGLV